MGSFSIKGSMFAHESNIILFRMTWECLFNFSPCAAGTVHNEQCYPQWHGPALQKIRVNRSISRNREQDKNFRHWRRALFTKSKSSPTCGSEHLQLDQTGWSGWILLQTWSLVAERKRRVGTTHTSVCPPRTSRCSQMPKNTASKL